MRALRSNLFAGVLLALLCAPPAVAGTAVSFWREGGLATTVFDGDALDLDPDPFELEVFFSLTNPGPGAWTATGTILATGGELVPAETIVTNVLIQNTGDGPVNNDAFFVEHLFESFLTAQPYTAELDGEYDKLVPNLDIGVADILYVPYIGNEVIGVIDPAQAVAVPPVQPFGGSSGPYFPVGPPINQKLEIRFYLDELGDAIRMFDSASITQVPEPGSLLLLLATVAGLARRAERR